MIIPRYNPNLPNIACIGFSYKLYKHYVYENHNLLESYNLLFVNDKWKIRGMQFIGHIWLDNAAESSRAIEIEKYLDIYGINEFSEIINRLKRDIKN